MSENIIGSAGVIALAGKLKCKNMKYLNLSHNNIDVEGVDALATLVQSCHLEKLDLSNNDIKSIGALCFLIELISYTHSANFNLLNNNISPKTLNFLTKKVLQRNTNLHALLGETNM